MGGAPSSSYSPGYRGARIVSAQAACKTVSKPQVPILHATIGSLNSQAYVRAYGLC